jgi:hypothetical protein
MINYKKMDEKDFIFIQKKISEKEEKQFSDFLKNRKIKSARSNRLKKKRTSLEKRN